MPLVTGIGSPGPVQPTSDAGHSGHTVSASGTSSFAGALSQVMSRTTSTALSGTSSPASSTSGAQSSAQRDTRPSLGDVFQPRHIPLVGSGHPSHDFQQLALGLRAYRQQIIASNIANADTPGYKAVDIDVPEALRVGYLPSNVPVQYVVPTQSSLDGNTVEMDTERAKFAENTVRYQFALDRVSAHYKMMMELLKNPN